MPTLPLRPKVPAILFVVSLISLALAGCAARSNGAPPPQLTGASDAVAGATMASATPPPDLVGLDGMTVQQWFGKPGLVRHDYPAEVWQYRDRACVLDVYLYPDADRMRVAHAEARDSQIQGDAMRACLEKFAELKRKAVG